jgi:hypothetical protein
MPHEEQVHEDDAGRAQQAHLAGHGGEDEVGLQVRHHRLTVAVQQEAAPEPGAQDAAVGDREQRLQQLVAGGAGVRPWVQPHLEAVLHVRHEEGRPGGGHGEEAAAEHHVDDA